MAARWKTMLKLGVAGAALWYATTNEGCGEKIDDLVKSAGNKAESAVTYVVNGIDDLVSSDDVVTSADVAVVPKKIEKEKLRPLAPMSGGSPPPEPDVSSGKPVTTTADSAQTYDTKSEAPVAPSVPVTGTYGPNQTTTALVCDTRVDDAVLETRLTCDDNKIPVAKCDELRAKDYSEGVAQSTAGVSKEECARRVDAAIQKDCNDVTPTRSECDKLYSGREDSLDKKVGEKEPIYTVPEQKPGTGKELAERLVQVQKDLDDCDNADIGLRSQRNDLYTAGNEALEKSGVKGPLGRDRTIEETITDLEKLPVKYGCEDAVVKDPSDTGLLDDLGYCREALDEVVGAANGAVDRSGFTRVTPGDLGETVAGLKELPVKYGCEDAVLTPGDASVTPELTPSGVEDTPGQTAPANQTHGKRTYDSGAGNDSVKVGSTGPIDDGSGKIVSQTSSTIDPCAQYGVTDRNGDGSTCDDLGTAYAGSLEQIQSLTGQCDPETVDRHTKCYESIKAVVNGSRDYTELNNVVSGIGSECLGSDVLVNYSVTMVLDAVTISATSGMDGEQLAEYGYVLGEASRIISENTGVGQGDFVEAERK